MNKRGYGYEGIQKARRDRGGAREEGGGGGPGDRLGPRTRIIRRGESGKEHRRAESM